MLRNENEYTIKVPGCSIHYWLSGNTGGPLLFFAHGACVDHAQFDLQLPEVVKDYQTVRWDMRGHGKSRPLTGTFSVKDVAEDAVAILERLKKKDAIFVGQSAGTYAMQELAFRHPDRVRAMAVIGGTRITAKLSLAESLELRVSPVVFAMWPYVNLKKAMVDASAVTPATKRYLTDAFDRLSKNEFVAIWKGLSSCPHFEPDYHVTCPLLLVRGVHDGTGNIKKAIREWASYDPQSTFVVVPGAGHCANQDNPTLFNQLLVRFLNDAGLNQAQTDI